MLCMLHFFFHFFGYRYRSREQSNRYFPNGTATSTPSSSFIESKRNLLRFKRNFLSSLEESLSHLAVIWFASRSRLLLKIFIFCIRQLGTCILLRFFFVADKLRNTDKNAQCFSAISCLLHTYRVDL